MNTRIRLLVLCAGLGFSLAAHAQSVQTLTLRPGGAEGIDAEVRTDFDSIPRPTIHDFIANAWTAQGNFFIARSLLKFDLTQIPSNAEVTQATLFLYTNLTTGHHQLDSGENASRLLRVTEPWVEEQVCWNNQPAYSPLDPVHLPQSVTHTQNYEVDVTGHVADMVMHPEANFGWMFKLDTEERYRCMVFASSDHANEAWRPMLVVTYRTCPMPEAGFSYEISGNIVQFTDLSSPAASWHWTFGDGDTSLLQNPMHEYPGPGNYQVCLTIGDSCGTDLYCANVMIGCDPPVAAFYYDRRDLTVWFSDTSSHSQPISRLWDFGDSTTSTLPFPVHEYSTYGTYLVCLTVTDTCGQDSCCDMVSLIEPCKPAFTSAQSETNDLNVAFTDESVNATRWSWDFGDGGKSAERNPVHTYSQYGTYPVCLTVGNDSGDTTACHTLVVKKVLIKTGDPSVLFYPNPSALTGSVNFVTIEDAPSLSLTLFDADGNSIRTLTFSHVLKNEPIVLDTRGLPAGTYLILSEFNRYRQTTKLELY